MLVVIGVMTFALSDWLSGKKKKKPEATLQTSFSKKFTDSQLEALEAVAKIQAERY